MARNIKITAADVIVQAQLNDSPTARAIWRALPIKAQGQRWGDEIYSSIPVSAELEADAREVLQAGELGYWPTGNAFCIFFGPTPASRGDEIRAASAVNIIGTVIGDWAELRDVPSGVAIAVEPL